MPRTLMTKLQGWMESTRGGGNQSRKILICLAAVLFLAVVLQTGWNQYRDRLQSLEDQIDLKTVQLEKQLRIVEQSQAYQQKNQELKGLREKILTTRLVQGDTPALAEAKLQNVVNDLAQETKVNILSMRMLPRKVENRITILRIGINGRAEIGSIQDFLSQISQDQRFLHVSELEIKIVNRREERYFNLSLQISALAHIT
ncbi:MAG: type II secretion system protein GspM [Desulfovermiculus sp.]|nr:type II secretion system protein GspM [Desulfovermiculus sp.]